MHLAGSSYNLIGQMVMNTNNVPLPLSCFVFFFFGGGEEGMIVSLKFRGKESI